MNKLLEDSKKAFESHCNNCAIYIKTTEFRLRVNSIEFCTTSCYAQFLQSQHLDQCVSCHKEIRGSTLRRIGNDLCNFCSPECIKIHLANGIPCKFCRTQICYDFCSTKCRSQWNKLYAIEALPQISLCIQCNQNKPVQCSLIHDDRVYKFCSFSCFFYLKTYAILFPGTIHRLLYSFILINFLQKLQTKENCRIKLLNFIYCLQINVQCVKYTLCARPRSR